MNLTHYLPLYAGYGAALGALLAILWKQPDFWPRRTTDGIKRPWIELAVVLVASIAIVFVGTALQHLRLDIKAAWLASLVDIALEIVRFSPLLLALFIMRVGRQSIWISPQRPLAHLCTGLGLAVVALGVFLLLRGAEPVAFCQSVMVELNRRDLHLPALALHVFFEDLAVAVLAARLLAVCRSVFLVAALVASLFAAGHIPALVTEGISMTEIASLTLDALLGTAVLLAIVRTRDILWFWPVHFVMDMTQFGRVDAQENSAAETLAALHIHLQLLAQRISAAAGC